METTIGGDRLGSGNKQNVSFRNYERSSHDLGYVWRSSMASGTLVPFMKRVALPGDKWEIDLNCDVMTLPTTGPLFGSYKVQLDVFEVPMRLYNAKLHQNKIGVGMDMKSIFLPQIELLAYNPRANGSEPTYDDNEQVSSSALMKYLGISGLGGFSGDTTPVKREFNAVALLAYWDIYKNYYSNKQEEIGYRIHTDSNVVAQAQTPFRAIVYDSNGYSKGDAFNQNREFNTGDALLIEFPPECIEPRKSSIAMVLANVTDEAITDWPWENIYWSEGDKIMSCLNLGASYDATIAKVKDAPSTPIGSTASVFGIKEFPLENIDTMREQILQHAGAGAFLIDKDSIEPYNDSMELNNTSGDIPRYSISQSQESLALKTYQSDLFNNWINTEWIDGTGGISDLTAVDTTDGNFTIDALNIASKVYDMLNRIAVSGGTYDDWLEAVYTHERVKGVENPIYCGSLIKELAFEEVISKSETSDKPLGTLAGRGRLTGKHKGGRITISVNEPSVLIGLVSLTPRIDYSQGNDWDVNLKTYDDFHKPALDGIGFQDLITEQLLWSDTVIASDNLPIQTMNQFSLGKQPAWINYMTEVNKTYGAFAEENNSMWMTLNRRYERTDGGAYGKQKLKDGTTYIDPRKYNQIFAETTLDAQNFWVQIACNITARRKMSAKIIPNL